MAPPIDASWSSPPRFCGPGQAGFKCKCVTRPLQYCDRDTSRTQIAGNDQRHEGEEDIAGTGAKVHRRPRSTFAVLTGSVDSGFYRNRSATKSSGSATAGTKECGLNVPISKWFRAQSSVSSRKRPFSRWSHPPLAMNLVPRIFFVLAEPLA